MKKTAFLINNNNSDDCEAYFRDPDRTSFCSEGYLIGGEQRLTFQHMDRTHTPLHGNVLAIYEHQMQYRQTQGFNVELKSNFTLSELL